MSRALVLVSCAACAAAAPAPTASPSRPAAAIQGGLTTTDTRVAAPPKLLDDLARYGHDAVDVELRVCLDERGQPTSTTLVSPQGLPADIARTYIDAIPGWRFTPYSVAGHLFAGCDTVTFHQRRDARDASGEMAKRPYLAVATAQVADRKYGRDPRSDVMAPPEVASEMRAHKLATTDPTFVVCFDASGVTDEVRLVGPADTVPGIVRMLESWVGTHRQAHPTTVEGVPVRSCTVRGFHVVAE